MIRQHPRKKEGSRLTRYGFSIVELIVAISIITLLSVTLLLQQNQFDSSIYLKNAAYETSLTIREAQIYAIRGQNVTGAPTCEDSGDPEFDCPYGVYFDSNPGDSDPDLVLFRDINDNGVYNGADETVEEYMLGDGNSIGSICGSASGSCSGEDELHVTFNRPSPTPLFKNSSISDARIELENTDGTTAMITIFASGQISVE